MTVVVIEPPQDLPVSLDEAKAHLRVDFDDDDDLIEALIGVATQSLDGPTGWLGRCLVTQTLEFRADRFEYCALRLPYPPVASITAIKYDDAAGIEQTVEPSNYRVIGSAAAPSLVLASGFSWPATRCGDEAVRIRYSVGWPVETEGDGDAAVTSWTGPAPIRHAILLLVSDLYENREATSETPRVELPFAVTALLSTFRILA